MNISTATNLGNRLVPRAFARQILLCFTKHESLGCFHWQLWNFEKRQITACSLFLQKVFKHTGLRWSLHYWKFWNVSMWLKSIVDCDDLPMYGVGVRLRCKTFKAFAKSWCTKPVMKVGWRCLRLSPKRVNGSELSEVLADEVEPLV